MKIIKIIQIKMNKIMMRYLKMIKQVKFHRIQSRPTKSHLKKKVITVKTIVKILIWHRKDRKRTTKFKLKSKKMKNYREWISLNQLKISIFLFKKEDLRLSSPSYRAMMHVSLILSYRVLMQKKITAILKCRMTIIYLSLSSLIFQISMFLLI